MPLASATMFYKYSLSIFVFISSVSLLQAQTENSPYSRYGLGDVVPSQNILNRGMGSVSAAYSDFQSVNFINPASYSKLKVTTFDFGVELDSRTIRSLNPPKKFNGVSPIISYIQLGVPLSRKKNWGMNFGLRPMSRINYNITENSRLPTIDSTATIYEGNGGSYEVYTGTGFSIKNLSLGVNFGYLFGSKDYSSKRIFISDSSFHTYLPANFETKSNFGGFFINGGLQYNAKLKKDLSLQFGAYGNLKSDMDATKSEIVETYTSSENGDARIDSIYQNDNIAGKLVYPSSYGVGFMLNNVNKWAFGVDYSATKWDDYRAFDIKDSVQNSWKIHVGGQVTPNAYNPKTYWGRVTYRAGVQFGRDYIRVNDDLPVWIFSFGAGLPMRKNPSTNQITVINTTFEIGQRGNKNNLIRENFFRFSLGLSLSDIWFIKPKYE